MSKKRIAVIGDVHGTIDELKELYDKLQHESVDELWTCGDLVDRGPDSGAVVAFARERGIRSIRGNHESVVLALRSRNQTCNNSDKRRTLESIRSDADWDYLASLPPVHVDDALGVVLVHGGLLPGIPLYRQPPQLICRLQLIHPDRLDHTVWFNACRGGIPEEDYLARGYRRWHEIYDHEQLCVFGHSVFRTPIVVPGRSGAGTCVGIDTGSVFGGHLTAVILPDLRFIQVKARRCYSVRVFGEDSAYGVDL